MDNKDKLRALVKETLEPVFSTLVDAVVNSFESIDNAFPADTTEEVKQKVLRDVIEANAKSLEHSIKSAIPTDFEAKLKEDLRNAE